MKKKYKNGLDTPESLISLINSTCPLISGADKIVWNGRIVYDNTGTIPLTTFDDFISEHGNKKVYKYKIDFKIARKTLEITRQVTIRGDK